MKNQKSWLFLLLLGMLIATASPAFSAAEENSFLAQENQTVLKKEGDVSKRYSPCSSFKIAISVMGYDAGILMDETHPEVAYEKTYGPCFLEIWKQPHNPKTWIEHSCVWYSQWITRQLGIEKFKKYVAAFCYGNQDLSGDPGKENGLTHAWLESSLKISAQEQVAFLQKLIACKLPASQRSQEMTEKILYVGELNNGWKLYGKTGSGNLGGWFVGWIEKENRQIVFAHHLVDNQPMPTPAGPRAKEAAKEKLQLLIVSLHE